MEFSKEVTEARSNMEIAQSELELYLSKYNSAVARLSQAQEALGSTSSTLKERKASIRDITGKLPQAEQQLKEVRLDFPISSHTQTKGPLFSLAIIVVKINHNPSPLKEH